MKTTITYDGQGWRTPDGREVTGLLLLTADTEKEMTVVVHGGRVSEIMQAESGIPFHPVTKMATQADNDWVTKQAFQEYCRGRLGFLMKMWNASAEDEDREGAFRFRCQVAKVPELVVEAFLTHKDIL